MRFYLKKKDKNYLFIENLKTKIKIKKLDYIKVRIFFIKAKKRIIQ